MRQEPTTARRVLRSAGLSALGFGLGLALAGLILGALTYQIHDFNTGRLLGSLPYACAGALGGAALAWVDVSKRRALLLALADVGGNGDLSPNGLDRVAVIGWPCGARANPERCPARTVHAGEEQLITTVTLIEMPAVSTYHEDEQRFSPLECQGSA